uniref:Membrane-associated kinase regulator 2 n=1 Tax=Nelumbo nucifera TaxID=4432 RepID=A0A822XGL7_NELNU|nr:TPA_asm: hypothetical protein HUJ06_020535 [Nelumbo nucifera]
MEAFSLLKYWRGGGGGGLANSGAPASANVRAPAAVTTIDTTVRQETDEGDDDEGPFFDLEFTVPDDDDGEGGGDDRDNHDEDDSNNGDGDEDDSDSAATDGEREFNFTVSSASSDDRTDPNLSLSPSDDLFFKGKLVPLESSSIVFNPSEPNSKHQFPVSLLKSATKFRVFMLGFKKPKSTTAAEKADTNGAAATSPKKHQQPQQKQQQDNHHHHHHHHGKLFTVKFKVEEVPIVSLFTRDNSSRNSSNKQQKQNGDETVTVTDDKRFSKDVVHKYLKMIKPLYIRASRRYGEKMRFPGHQSLGLGKAASPPAAAAATTETLASSPTKTKSNLGGEAGDNDAPTSNVKLLNHKQGNLPAGLRVVCKHLGKSRLASSAVAAVQPVGFQARRCDDSLLQQQDGIQSAILHCKRSFNASIGIDLVSL